MLTAQDLLITCRPSTVAAFSVQVHLRFTEVCMKGGTKEFAKQNIILILFSS